MIKWFVNVSIAFWLTAFFNIVCLGTEVDLDPSWPQWRGPLGTGVAPNADPPIEWSESKNVRWKLPLPGSGHSTPIIWGNLIFVTAAAPFGNSVKHKPDQVPGAHDNLPSAYQHRFMVLAVGRKEGKIAWQRTLREELPHEGGHFTGSLASNSPVTDGNHVFAYFGSRGLYCLDMLGKLIWEIDLGDMETRHAHGEGSSPALHGDTLIVNWDHQGDSFILALEKLTGKQRWKIRRDEITSWSTPLIVVHNGKPQVIVSATNRVRSYNLHTGEVIWECSGLSRNVVASPVSSSGIVYVSNSYDWQAMLAIRLDGAKGDITDTDQIAWRLHRNTPYVPTPLLYKGMLYFLKHNQGLLSCVDAKTGEIKYGPIRLQEIRNVFSSPVGAADKVYITDCDGATVVLSYGDKPNILAQNQLDDSFSASPAMVESELYLRGRRSLYCIAKD